MTNFASTLCLHVMVHAHIVCATRNIPDLYSLLLPGNRFAHNSAQYLHIFEMDTVIREVRDRHDDSAMTTMTTHIRMDFVACVCASSRMPLFSESSRGMRIATRETAEKMCPFSSFTMYQDFCQSNLS